MIGWNCHGERSEQSFHGAYIIQEACIALIWIAARYAARNDAYAPSALLLRWRVAGRGLVAFGRISALTELVGEVIIVDVAHGPHRLLA